MSLGRAQSQMQEAVWYQTFPAGPQLLCEDRELGDSCTCERVLPEPLRSCQGAGSSAHFRSNLSCPLVGLVEVGGVGISRRLWLKAPVPVRCGTVEIQPPSVVKCTQGGAPVQRLGRVLGLTSRHSLAVSPLQGSQGALGPRLVSGRVTPAGEKDTPQTRAQALLQEKFHGPTSPGIPTPPTLPSGGLEPTPAPSLCGWGLI